jgi:hypothetical protein
MQAAPQTRVERVLTRGQGLLLALVVSMVMWAAIITSVVAVVRHFF